MDDVRFTAVAGTASCETSYFFKRRAGGGYGVLLHLSGGKTYVVAVTPSPVGPHQARVARIYLADRSGARKVGEVETKADWKVSIDRQPSDRPW